MRPQESQPESTRMKDLKVYIDGTLYDKADAKISVFDHGLLYGDGIFEGIRAYNGTLFLLSEHLDRLYDGAHVLQLKMPLDRAAMEEALYRTLAANGLTDAYIRLIITRGEGDLGLSPLKCEGNASIIIIAASIALYPEEAYQKGLEIITVPTVSVQAEALSPRLKSLNYLNNILAKLESIHAGMEEALMLNSHGYVSECSADNIFIIRNNELLTPPPTAGILVGCTRNTVMDLARKEKMAVKEVNLHRYDLYTADECFLTGTAAEVIPVIKIDHREIGSGQPGSKTQLLLKRFREFIEETTNNS